MPIVIEARKRPLHHNPSAVRRHRLIAGLRQDELADRAQISPGFVSKIENGRRTTSVGVLHRLAEALNCSVDDLIANDTPPREGSTAP